MPTLSGDSQQHDPNREQTSIDVPRCTRHKQQETLMFFHRKETIIPVEVKSPDPRFGQFLLDSSAAPLAS
jgi:hypothetical protein